MDCDKSDVKRKMDNLLSQLRREKIKMRQRMMGEKAWQPTWYGYELMSFLHNRKFSLKRTSPEEEQRNKIKQNIIEQNRSIEIPDTNSEKEDDTNDTIEQNDDSNSEVDEDDEPYVMVVCKDDPVNPLSDKPDTTNDEDTLSHSIFDSPPVKIKKMSVPNRRTSSSVRSFASAAGDHDVPSLDENQLYANFIASKFRSNTVSTRNRLQHEISLLLYRADNGEFDNNK
ncbi:uncharacterized protein LOC121735855 [Aricia agestis]|uniref:uncharacterized protein LOC121735855 n=1 Tax=Aricia agestis TaxID=91739 RepID=UPI001C20B776|nr:uncharacterized protein LOC121735855 [Aricia agestis]